MAAVAIAPRRAVVTQEALALNKDGAGGAEKPSRIRRGSTIRLTHEYETAMYGLLEADNTPVWIEKKVLKMIGDNVKEKEESKKRPKEEQESGALELLGVALHCFDAKDRQVPHGLSLEQGDELDVLGEEGHWYFGRSHRTDKSGIFPKSYVKLQARSKSEEAEVQEVREEEEVVDVVPTLRSLCEAVAREAPHFDAVERLVLGDVRKHCSRSFARVMLGEMQRRRESERLALAQQREGLLEQADEEHGVLIGEIDRLSSVQPSSALEAQVASLQESLVTKDAHLASARLKMQAMQQRLADLENSNWLREEMQFLQPK